MKQCISIFLLVLFSTITVAQNNILYFENPKSKSVSFDFKLRNNLIIVPVQINESDTLNFILDTGLKTSLITKLPLKDSLMLKFAQKRTVKGLGTEGELDVYLSYGNKINMNGIKGDNFNFFIITDDKFDLSAELGMDIHGLIGADIFENFIVTINYSKNTLKFSSPESFKYSRRYLRQESFPLTMHKSKPYITLSFTNEKNVKSNVKLLIDSGSSDALWLFLTNNKNVILPENKRYSFLGKGLSGKVFGYQGRVKAVQLGKYEMFNVTTSFPDSVSVSNTKTIDIIGRDGSVGAEFLRRFNLIIDYHNKKITFKKNHNYKDKFKFNMAGMEVGSVFGLLPIYAVTYLQENSPAYNAGIKLGDQIMKINGVDAYKYSVLEINGLMRTKDGKKIKINLMRNGKEKIITFRLKENL